MPERKTPSNVPAPPIEVTGAPIFFDCFQIRYVGPNKGAEYSADVGQSEAVFDCWNLCQNENSIDGSNERGY